MQYPTLYTMSEAKAGMYENSRWDCLICFQSFDDYSRIKWTYDFLANDVVEY